MNNSSLLGAIKRRWWIIILMAVVGTVLGALPQPEKVEEQVRTFTATHTLIVNDAGPNQTTGTVIAPTQVTLFITTGEVPARVAEVIGFSGNPASLASQITSVFDFGNNSLTITTTQNDADRAEVVADTFADELNSYLAERQDFIYQQRLAASLERLTELEVELTELTRELLFDPEDPVLAAQQSAVSRQYSVAFEQSELLAASPPVIGFTTLQRAQAIEVTDRGLSAPTSRSSRGMLGGIVGVAVGLGAVLLLAQLDRRIRTREQAEDLYDMRARVIIPKVRDKDRDQLLVAPDRHDALSDAYRTVRSVVEFLQPPIDERGRAPVTLVVSAGPGDGKTSLAANLGAAMAENGKRTVLVNADFRRPRLFTVFGPDAEEPLPFLYEDIDRLHHAALMLKTGRPRLELFDLSSVDAPAGELVRATLRKIDDVAGAVQSVVIDTSPVGATAEVLELVPRADTIVVVARVGHTRVDDARRAIAILRDLTSVPIILVLGGIKTDRFQYEEYDDRKPQPPKPKRRWLPRSAPLYPESEPELEAVE